MRSTLTLLLALSLVACGVQRPLIKPSEIPAYEAQQKAKREKLAKEQAEQEQQKAADAAARKMIEDAQ